MMNSKVPALAFLEIRSKWRIYTIVISLSFFILAFYYFNSSFSILSLFTSGSSFVPNFQSFSSIPDSAGSKFHLIYFPQAFFLVLGILTSISFSEYRNDQEATFYLSLPAARIEKWLAKLLIYLIIIPIAYLILYQSFMLLTGYWNTPVSSKQVTASILDPYILERIKWIVSLQCILLLGATIFKKYSFFKIALTAGLLFFTYRFLQIAGFLIFNGSIDYAPDQRNVPTVSLNQLLENSGHSYTSIHEHPFGSFIGLEQSTLLVVISILALFISYLKFRELEA